MLGKFEDFFLGGGIWRPDLSWFVGSGPGGLRKWGSSHGVGWGKGVAECWRDLSRFWSGQGNSGEIKGTSHTFGQGVGALGE